MSPDERSPPRDQSHESQPSGGGALSDSVPLYDPDRQQSTGSLAGILISLFLLTALLIQLEATGVPAGRFPRPILTGVVLGATYVAFGQTISSIPKPVRRLLGGVSVLVGLVLLEVNTLWTVLAFPGLLLGTSLTEFWLSWRRGN